MQQGHHPVVPTQDGHGKEAHSAHVGCRHSAEHTHAEVCGEPGGAFVRYAGYASVARILRQATRGAE